MPDKDIHSLFEDKLSRLTDKTSQQIREAYEQAIVEITLKAASIVKPEEAFNIKHYPTLLQQIEKTIKDLHASIYAGVINSVKSAWDLSNEKNDLILDKRLQGKQLDKEAKAIYYDPNKEALNAFVKRKDKGLNLSDRVWNLLDNYKTEMEGALGVTIGEGKSAAKSAGELKRFLNEPDKLFRRVRDAKGKLKLSKAAKNYHPGQGVYRSSYKNALRLTRTETNLSYRNADYDRWQRLPFIVGIEIKLSNSHKIFDICDHLSNKRYPKEFHFNGWHPQCKCFAKPIQLTPEEYEKYEDAILDGKEPDVSSKNRVEDTPKEFKEWVKDNEERIKGWKNRPYWYEQNKQFINPPVKPKVAEFVPAKTIGEAEKWAKDNGLAGKIDYRKVGKVEYANEINKTLKKALDEHGVRYDEVEVVDRQNKSNLGIIFSNTPTYAKGVKQKQTLTFNVGTFNYLEANQGKNIAEFIKETYDKKYWVAEKMEDLINHEIGHFLTMPESLRDHTNMVKATKGIKYNISIYGKTKGTEAMAEIWALYKKSGKDALKTEWIELFNQYSKVKI